MALRNKRGSRVVRIPTLETERLLLRPPRADDLDVLVELGADADVMRYIGSGATYSRAVAQEWLERLLEEADIGVPGPPGLPGWLVLSVKASDTWAGLAGLKILASQHADAIGIDPIVEVGYRLAGSCWGKGYATEAARALLQYGFEDLGLRQIAAIADVRNLASNRVLGKVGMICRKTYSLDGRAINFHSLSRPEYYAGPKS
jgi:[ribosomal protein S5]-alanine N-acetyltransferase